MVEAAARQASEELGLTRSHFPPLAQGLLQVGNGERRKVEPLAAGEDGGPQGLGP